jgi:hypothetical protein
MGARQSYWIHRCSHFFGGNLMSEGNLKYYKKASVVSEEAFANDF